MSLKKKNTAGGVITFHTPLPVSLLKSEECMSDVKNATESRTGPSQPSTRMRSSGKCVRAGKRDEASPSGQQSGARKDGLSHTSLRQLQAKMEAENQQAKEIIQPLLDTENGYMKELEKFLNQRDVTELRKKELLHKRWTERVWVPLQRRVEEHVSSCSPVETRRRQTSYNHYLRHCNTKGFVFLETYDLREYNPFLLHIKKPHYFKLSKPTADLKDPLYLQLHERLKAKRNAHSCEAGYKYKLPQKTQADIFLLASSNYPVSASRRIPAEDETEGRMTSRRDAIPYPAPYTLPHQMEGAIRPSRCEGRQLPASLHESWPTSK